MNVELRIIAGSHRGRKLRLPLDPDLRPMADRVRAALFSILGNAVPDRPFFDVFAGSGAVGMEALSRGASWAVFVEKEGKNVTALLKHLKVFGLHENAKVLQADAYRWGEKGDLPAEPVNVFLGPPYPEFEDRLAAVEDLVRGLQKRLQPGSVLILQSDKQLPVGIELPGEGWDCRKYGRTQLAIWVKPLTVGEGAVEQPDGAE